MATVADDVKTTTARWGNHWPAMVYFSGFGEGMLRITELRLVESA
jgi:hypothetical protein